MKPTILGKREIMEHIKYIYIYIRTYIHTYVHTCIRTYIHTYIHTHNYYITNNCLLAWCFKWFTTVYVHQTMRHWIQKGPLGTSPHFLPGTCSWAKKISWIGVSSGVTTWAPWTNWTKFACQGKCPKANYKRNSVCPFRTGKLLWFVGFNLQFDSFDLYPSICMYVCMHVCMHACIHPSIHTYMHTYIHTYIHTIIQSYNTIIQ